MMTTSNDGADRPVGWSGAPHHPGFQVAAAFAGDDPANPAKAIRLTPPQVELLTDITAHYEMFITRFSIWDRTAQSLVRKKLATSRWCEGGQYAVRITDDGWAEAVRRGIVKATDPRPRP